MSNVLTQLEFIARSKAIECVKPIGKRGIINYDKFEFAYAHKKSILGCDNHDIGTFWFKISPNNYYHFKTGCPICENRPINWDNYSLDFYLKEKKLPFIRIGDFKGTKIKIDFLCLITEPHIVNKEPFHVIGEKGCLGCTKLNNHNIDKKLKEQGRDGIIARVGNSTSSTDYISWKCLINPLHKEWEALVSGVVICGTGCKECSDSISRTTLKLFIEKATNIHKNNYSYHLIKDEHINNKNSIVTIWCNVCKIQHEFYQSITDHTRGHGCIFIKLKQEKIIFDFLKSQNIDFIYQYKIGKFIVDFYLPQYNMFIEYNGRQHYEPVKWGSSMSDTKAIVKLNQQIKRDNMLKKFSISNSINFFDIDGRIYQYKSLLKFLNTELRLKLSAIQNTINIVYK